MAAMVTRQEIVAACLTELRKQDIHPAYIGYLCIKRTAASEGRTSNLSPNFKEFHDVFLRVPGGTPDKPYIRPTDASDKTIWLNKNVAGSYAPSSIRSVSPLWSVVDISKGKKPLWSLKRGHFELAREHLTSGKRIPVLPLSVFLYRDMALQSENATFRDWIQVFREEFGYPDSAVGNREFEGLYTTQLETTVVGAGLETFSPELND